MPNTNPPMVRAALLMPLLLHFEKRGGDVGLLLDDMNISRAIRTDTDLPVASKAIYETAAEIATRLGDRFVGATVGREMAKNAMGALAVDMVSELTVGNLLDRFLMSVKAYGNSTDYRAENDGLNVTLKMTRKAQPDVIPAQPDAITLAFLVEQIRPRVGSAWSNSKVLAVVADETVVPDWLLPRSSLITGSSLGLTLRFPAQWMVLSQSDPNGENKVRQVGAKQKSLVEAVQDFCREHMSDPKLNLARAARACRMHPKALSRSLSNEGASFKDILEEQRRLFAMAEIAEGKLSVSDIALQSGFTQASNFTRAYKRWTGETPSAFRDRKRENSK